MSSGGGGQVSATDCAATIDGISALWSWWIVLAIVVDIHVWAAARPLFEG